MVVDQVHVADLRRLFEAREYASDLVCMARSYLPPVSLLEQELETLVAEASYHMSSVTTHLSFLKKPARISLLGKDHVAVTVDHRQDIVGRGG